MPLYLLYQLLFVEGGSNSMRGYDQCNEKEWQCMTLEAVRQTMEPDVVDDKLCLVNC